MTAPRTTLADRLARGPLDWSDAARLALEVVDALAERGGAWAGPDRIEPSAVLLEPAADAGPPTLATLGSTETAAEPQSTPVPRGVRAVARLLLAMLGAAEADGDATAADGTEDGAEPLPAPLRPLLSRALRSPDARALATWGGLREALWNALHLADPGAAFDGASLPAALVRRVQLDARGRSGTRDAVWCVIRLPGGEPAQAVLTVDPDDTGTAHHARTLRGLWPGAELAAYGLPAPAEGSTAERFVFPLRPETLLVLEPRRLFEVTAVASAFETGCPCNFLAGLLEGTGAISPALLGGRMADAALRVLLEHPERPDTAVAGEALRSSRVDAAWIRTESQLAQAEAIVRKAVPQLRAWLGRRAAGPETLNEVSRLAPRFGLSGRSDLVFPRPDGPPAVGELKSGQALRYDAPPPVAGTELAALRPSHATQARLYALLWTDAWRRAHPDQAGHAAANRVATELFYAADGKAFRLGPEARELSRSLAARNAMLDLFRRAVDGEPLPPPPRFAACDRCWRRSACPCPPDGRPALWGAVGPAAPPADASHHYLGHFARLLLRAVWHAQGERRRSLEPLTLPARAAQLVVETDLTLGFAPADPLTATLRGELHGALHAEDGARVRAHRGDPGALEAFEAELAHVGREGYELRLDRPHPPWVAEGPGWVLEPAGGFDNEREGFEGLLRLRHRGDGPLVAELLGAAPAATEARPRIELPAAPFPNGWHPSQAAAFERALNGGALELVQGPPGTGKTTFVGALVAALVAAGRRVLVSALTHNAADLAARRIVEAGATDVLRIGARNDATALRQALAAAGADPERAFLEPFALRAHDARAVRARLREARVVVANGHRLGRLPWRHEFRAGGDPPFDVAVLDEATQLSEPLALAVLALARRAVLVGDPRQLSCVEPSAQEWPPAPPADPALVAAGVGPLDRSLHERLCAARPSAMLREQHRMHERIMALPNRAFYGGALEAAPEVRTRLLELELPAAATRSAWLDAAVRPDEPLVLVDVAGGADGRRNEREAALVAETAAMLRRAGLRPEQLGVVTPYRAQAALIRRRLAADPELGAIPVDTVERFQGDERDAILVSLVGARPTGHLAHPNRLNVTLTRARRKLVVFGDVAGLSADPLLAELARQAETTVVRGP